MVLTFDVDELKAFQTKKTCQEVLVNYKMSAVANEDQSSKVSPANRNIAVINDRIDSRNIFVGTREVTISHGEDVYRLRLTAQNKLILTK